jgi:hypothetical protein
MKNLTIAAMLFLLTTTSSSAQKIQIPITMEATREVNLGDPIEIRAEGIEGDVKCIWDAGLFDTRTRLYESGRVLAFWPNQSGRYRFVLVICSAEPEKKVYFVTVKGALPDIPDDPDDPSPPKPPPKPRFPDEELGLSTLVYKEALSFSDAKTIGPKLALNHRGLASKLRAVQNFTTPQAIGELKKLNTETFKSSSNAKAWTDLLRDQVGKALQKASQEGKLDTKAQVAEAFLELAAGFESLAGPK